MSKGYRDAFLAYSKSSAQVAGRSAYYELESGMLADPYMNTEVSQLRVQLQHLLQNKLHGLAYSPYMDGQEPGMEISVEQITQRLHIIAPYTRWIRTFSCTEGNQHAPEIAKAMGLQTMVGVSIGEDEKKNQQELENGIAIAQAGHADILAVGNEVLLRGDIAEEQLIGYIEQAKQAVPGQQVAYVDAYFLFENHPKVAEACDMLLINCYPFWEETQAQYALAHMQSMYQRAVAVAHGKPVIISETGWPTQGSPFGAAMPGMEAALAYAVSTYQWANQAGVPVFYFAAFDEAWKTGDEGDVGAYWGLWDSQGNLKF